MTYVYLDFVSSLQNIFKTIMDKVLVPVLTQALKHIFDLVLLLVQDIVNQLLMGLFTTLLSLIDYVAEMFNVLCGLRRVTYGNAKDVTLLEALFQVDTLSSAFLKLTVVAVILTFLFTMFSVIRSMGDSALDQRHPISEALRWAAKSALTFLLIPMLCLTMLQMSKAVFSVANQLEYTNTRTGDHKVIIQGSTPGDVLFVSMVQDALKYPKEIQNSEAAMEEYKTNRLDYYLTRLGDVPSKQFTYSNADQVAEDVDATKVNMVVALASSACVLLLMLGASLTLVRRTFEVLVLYLVSPFFAATIALDGGNLYRKWREAFIGRFFAGAGTLITIKLFLILLPCIASNRFQYSSDTRINAILTTLFILGGAWATFKGNALIQQILDPEGAQSEQRERDRMLGFAMGAAHFGMGQIGKMAGGQRGGKTKS